MNDVVPAPGAIQRDADAEFVALRDAQKKEIQTRDRLAAEHHHPRSKAKEYRALRAEESIADQQSARDAEAAQQRWMERRTFA